MHSRRMDVLQPGPLPEISTSCAHAVGQRQAGWAGRRQDRDMLALCAAAGRAGDDAQRLAGAEERRDEANGGDRRCARDGLVSSHHAFVSTCCLASLAESLRDGQPVQRCRRTDASLPGQNTWACVSPCAPCPVPPSPPNPSLQEKQKKMSWVVIMTHPIPPCHSRHEIPPSGPPQGSIFSGWEGIDTWIAGGQTPR